MKDGRTVENSSFEVLKDHLHMYVSSDLFLLALSLFGGALIMFVFVFAAIAINVIARGKMPEDW